MATTKKTLVGTIDITPTWRAILPLLIEALTNGTEAGRRMAKEELNRMADMADLANQKDKK